MAEIEYGGIKVGGSRLLLVLPLLGTLGGGLWAGFEFYKDYMNMKEIISNIDTDEIAARNAVLETKLDEALADGQLTLDEAMGLVDDAKEIVEEVKSLPSYSKMKRMRKSEIMNLCAEHGIDTKGTKDELIDKLKEAVK